MPFDFDKQFSIGEKGEQLIARCFGWQRLSGYGADLLTPKGARIELKTDSYASTATNNFFIERYGDIRKQSPGGPWKAQRDRCAAFLYLFWPDKVLYGFKVRQLLQYLEARLDHYETRIIANKTWKTGGYLVPQWELKPLAKITRLTRLERNFSEKC